MKNAMFMTVHAYETEFNDILGILLISARLPVGSEQT